MGHKNCKKADNRVIVIAEIGENHIGDMNIARTLIRQAAGAGVDYVKFQSYQPQNFRINDPEYKWFKRVCLSDAAHFMLKEYAQKHNVGFLSSPFSLERARFLRETLGLKYMKVASGMLLNFPVLDYLNCAGIQTIFLSTGMATTREIRAALARLKKIKKIYLLHCVSQYPCKDAETNLLSIDFMRKKFIGYDIGYSDHTIGCLASIVAVGLGARVIEKHFTLNKDAKEGTDHILSADPEELKDMVSKIRRVEVFLGAKNKEPALSESKIKHFIRNRFI